MRTTVVTALAYLVMFVSTAWAEETHFHYIDLQSQANQQLDQDFFPGNFQGDALSELTKGDQELGEIPFRIGEGLIQVAGKFLPEHPMRVEGIEVGQHVKKLHILHAARWGAYGKRGDNVGHWIADGTPIGYYEVVYADGGAEAIPIVYGVDVRDWWSIWDDSKPVKRGEVVWAGSNPHLRRRTDARHTATPLRLYHTTWENPRPESPVASVSIVSVNQTATPFCVAVTVENATGKYDARIRELEKNAESLNADLREPEKLIKRERKQEDSDPVANPEQEQENSTDPASSPASSPAPSPAPSPASQ